MGFFVAIDDSCASLILRIQYGVLNNVSYFVVPMETDFYRRKRLLHRSVATFLFEIFQLTLLG